MKKILLLTGILIVFFTTQKSEAVMKFHTFSSSNQHFSGDPVVTQQIIKYEQVYIYCNPIVCDLSCSGETETALGKTCSWENVTNCFGCENDGWRIIFWEPSNAIDLYEDALDQIKNGNYTGNYTLNYVNSNNNITYYRTLTWEHNQITNISTINITISFDDGL